MILFVSLPLFAVMALVLVGFVFALYLGVNYYGVDIWLAGLTVLVWGIAAIVVFWSADMAEQACVE